jgi:glycine hydroxymethyltransferase
MTQQHLLTQFAARGIDILHDDDPDLYALLAAEYRRQAETLIMVASSSIVDPSVAVCEGLTPVNVTAEGYPGARYHAGCDHIDGIEQLAIDRAKQVFRAQFANVQAHSATTANFVVFTALLQPGDKILGMSLPQGGHLTHGAKASLSGQYWNGIGYGVDDQGRIDYEQVARLAREHRPKLIICGATAYTRLVDFARFRAIADEVGAYLMADISHIAGLVAAGLHPSPIDHAHITTTCTHKQLFGPRGGIIMMGRDHDAPAPGGRTLAQAVQRAVFPGMQGAPNVSSIAAKARALAIVATPAFRAMAERIIANARHLAVHLTEQGLRVVSGGSENHTVLLDLGATNLTGIIAQNALEQSDIIVNKNCVPGDRRSVFVTSGIRIGTNSLACRGMGAQEMRVCASLIARTFAGITPVGEREFQLDPSVREAVRREVAALCARFPIPRYPAASNSVRDGVTR